MAKIKTLTASEILDSRGFPTIRAYIELSDNTAEHSSVAQGVAHHTYEAIEVRDEDQHRFAGHGVTKAVSHINNEIAQKIVGMEVTDQRSIDKALIDLDGTQNKANLGANATLAVSQVVAKAAAKSTVTPLWMYLRNLSGGAERPKKIPTPIFNMLEGGIHAAKHLDLQEFLVIPATSKTFQESLELGFDVYNALKNVLTERNMSTFIADEGGFSPQVPTNIEALSLLRIAIEATRYQFSLDVFLGLDAAADSFKNEKKYVLRDKDTPYTVEELSAYYMNIAHDFSLIYLEDPFAEDDWEGWKKIHDSISSNTLIVGDNVTATNPYRLQLAIDNNVINAMCVKPNQIGTVTETLAVVEMAHFKELKVVVSHRSGETEDTFLSDFAVAVGADYVKFGPPVRERVAKLNRIREIEQQMAKL
jgi:enolase